MTDTTPSPSASERAQSIHSDMPVLTAAFYELLYRRITSEITAAEQAAKARGGERMRERAAQIADARYAEAGWCGDYKHAATVIADGIRALPLEEEK